MEHVQTKRCSKCGEVKPVGEFYMDSRREYGRACFCKKCDAAYQANWRAENRDKVNAKCAKYRSKNKEKLNAMYSNRREELVPSYVARLLHMPVSELTTEILEAKRQQITLHRISKQIKQLMKEQQS